MNNDPNYVKVRFFYWHEGQQNEQIESMWASKTGDNYKLENIPFYVSEYALGDIVSAENNDGNLFVKELIEESGNSTIQIIFFDRSIVEKIRNELKNMGCSSEGSERFYYVAVNIPSNVDYFGLVKRYLDNGQKEDLWDYCEACIASSQNEGD